MEAGFRKRAGPYRMARDVRRLRGGSRAHERLIVTRKVVNVLYIAPCGQTVRASGNTSLRRTSTSRVLDDGLVNSHRPSV